MPNPYHDEAGRFCSKEEMGAAVSRLADAIPALAPDNAAKRDAALENYFALRNEFEAAKREEPRRAHGVFPHQVNTPPLPAPPPFGEGLPDPFAKAEAESEARLSECAAASEKDYADLSESQLVALSAVLRQQKTASWGSAAQLAAHDFYADAPAKAKVAVLAHMSKHSSYVSEDIARSMLASDFGSSREIVDIVLIKSELPVKDKLALARLHERTAYLAARNPRAVIDSPAGERQLLAEIRRMDSHVDANERQAGWQQLAASSATPATLAEIRRKFVSASNYDPSITRFFAQNYNLTAQDNEAVLRITVRNDVNLWVTSLGYMTGRASRSGEEGKARSLRLGDISKRYTQLVAEGSPREAAANQATQEYLTGTLDGEAARNAPVNRLRPIR